MGGTEPALEENASGKERRDYQREKYGVHDNLFEFRRAAKTIDRRD